MILGVLMPGLRAQAFTVYFDNATKNWATPYIHYWGGSSSSSWPGRAMTLHAGTIWRYDVPDDTKSCLFNAGDGDNTKTDNMTATAEHVYTPSGDSNKTYDQYIQGGGGNESQGPAELYISSDSSSAQWVFGTSSLSKNGSKFTGSVSCQNTDKNYITFTTAAITGNWNLNGGTRYTPANTNDDLEVTSGMACTMQTGSSKCWVIKGTGEWDFTVDFGVTPPTVTFTKKGGGDIVISDVKPTGTLPVIHINVYTDTTKTVLQNEIIDKDLSHKDYFSCAEYWVDVNGCEWMIAEGAQSIGSEAEPLPLEIKARGNFSRKAFSKKPFKLKLGKKQNLLGLTPDKSKHYALIAHSDDDKGYLRNFTGFNLGRRIGLPWAPGQQPVEVVINGDYRGLYFLTESIRIGDGRIMIEELDDNVSDPTLASGGYLVELDNYEETNQISMDEKSCVSGQTLDKLRVTWDTPEAYSAFQKKFVTDEFTKMNDLVGSNSDDLWKYMELDDAARYYLVMEIISHWEAYHGSTYMFRDRGEGKKWHFSPLWDCGNAFGGPTDNFFYNADSFGNTWIPSLRANAKFNAKVSETWKWFMTNCYDGLMADIDSYVEHISAAAVQDHKRWGGKPKPVFDGACEVADNSDMAARKAFVVDHLNKKINWLKTQFGDYTGGTFTEPERDTTPAQPLPDYFYIVPNEYKVQFNDDKTPAWSQVKAYAYSGEGDAAVKYLGEWPGTSMTKNGALWTLSFLMDEEIPAGTKIIFNNGNSGNGNQTGNLDFVSGKTYYRSGYEPIEPTGTLPVVYINVYTDATKTTLESEIIDKDLSHKNYFSNAEYWVDMKGCDWMGAKAVNVGSAESPLPLEIKARGNYTRTGFAKKPYKLKLANKQALLGLTKSKHFALLAHADDNFGYMRNFTGFNLGKRIGLPWTPAQQPVEVVINGDYRGIYFLTESIRVEGNRINADELDDNISNPALVSGAYLVELDNYEEGDQIKMPEGGNSSATLLVTPDTPEIYSDLQRTFVTDQFTEMNNYVGSRSDELWKYMDLDDAARYYLVEEIISHYEAYHGSTYLFRDNGEGQKWHFSPLWDCGHAFDGGTNEFFYNHTPNYGNTWIRQLCGNAKFMDKVKETWRWFMGTQYDGLVADIEAYAGHISEAALLDRKRWKDAPQPSSTGGNNPSPVVDNSDMASRLNSVKNHLSAKIAWLKGQWGEPAVVEEPARDTTPAAALPDYAKMTYPEAAASPVATQVEETTGEKTFNISVTAAAPESFTAEQVAGIRDYTLTVKGRGVDVTTTVDVDEAVAGAMEAAVVKNLLPGETYTVTVVPNLRGTSQVMPSGSTKASVTGDMSYSFTLRFGNSAGVATEEEYLAKLEEDASFPSSDIINWVVADGQLYPAQVSADVRSAFTITSELYYGDRKIADLPVDGAEPVDMTVSGLPYIAKPAEGNAMADPLEEAPYKFTVKTTYTRMADNEAAVEEISSSHTVGAAEFVSPRADITGVDNDRIMLGRNYLERYYGLHSYCTDAFLALKVNRPFNDGLIGVFAPAAAYITADEGKVAKVEAGGNYSFESVMEMGRDTESPAAHGNYWWLPLKDTSHHVDHNSAAASSNPQPFFAGMDNAEHDPFNQYYCNVNHFYDPASRGFGEFTAQTASYYLLGGEAGVASDGADGEYAALREEVAAADAYNTPVGVTERTWLRDGYVYRTVHHVNHETCYGAAAGNDHSQWLFSPVDYQPLAFDISYRYDMLNNADNIEVAIGGGDTPLNAPRRKVTVTKAAGNVDAVRGVDSDTSISFPEMTISSDGPTTGIDGIEAGSVEGLPLYYNLQGMRISTPRAGNVYIVRRGGVVTKELFR